MTKTTLDRDALKACNIFYDPEPRTLPPHIQDLKQNLLDFDWTIFEGIDELDSDLGYKPLEKMYPGEAQKALLIEADKHAQKALNLDKRRNPEPEWQHFFSAYFKNALATFNNETKTDSRV